MDVVYILRNRSNNEYRELRYSLRSLKNINYDNLYIIGGNPVWLQNARWVAASDCHKNKALNALDKLMIACDIPELSDDFILMNDDFYLLEPQEIKYLSKGKLRQTVIEKKAEYNGSKYWYSMDRTAKKFKDPLDFELHYPFIFNKKKFQALEDKYKLCDAFLFRSLYGNYYKINGEFCKDNKCYSMSEFRNNINNKFISSSDSYINTQFTEYMDRLFPELSKYERW